MTDSNVRGPFDPAKIRHMLRTGEADPFDLAYAEGSSLQRPILDIDEIFELQSEGLSLDETKDDAEGLSFNTFVTQEVVPLENPRGFLGEENLHLAKFGEGESKQKNESQSAPAKPPLQTPIRSSNVRPRLFYVFYPGSQPVALTGLQILQGFKRGLFNSKTLVAKERQSAKVPIERFVLAYGQGLVGKGPSLKNKVPNKSSGDPLLTGVVALALCLFVASFLIFMRLPSFQKRWKPASQPPKAAQIRALKPKASSNSDAPKPPLKAEKKPVAPALSKPKPQGHASQEGVKKPQQKVVSAVKPVTKATPVKRATKSPVVQKRVPPIRPNVVQRVVPVVTPTRNVQPQVTPAFSLRDQMMLQSHTVRYALVDVQSCVNRGGSCAVTMAGQGVTFTGAFFAGAWGPSLISKKGTARVSGLVRQIAPGSFKVLISKVE